MAKIITQVYENGIWRNETEEEIAQSARLAASSLGRLGGLAKSEAKSSSSRENGRKGGRPKSTKSIDIEDI